MDSHPLSSPSPEAPSLPLYQMSTSPSQSGGLHPPPSSPPPPARRSNPPSRATSRSRSASPGSSPTPGISSTISPQSSRIFTSRPSPVVPPSQPASPSFSRPTSPRPHVSRQIEEPASPTSAHHDLSLSASGSTVDLSHIFERDVEFASTHHITPSEAVDVAIPPVLDEAVAALSSDEITSSELASSVRESEDTSGWSSPVTVSSVHISHQHSYATASRSPVRGSGARSFSPDSFSSGGREISPVGSPPLNIEVSGSSPPPTLFHPFTQHLSDALLDTSNLSHSPPAFTIPPVPFNSSPVTGVIPFPSVIGATSDADSLPASPSIENLHDHRRLSFMSLADIINDERLGELTGNSRTMEGGPSI